MKTKLEKLLMLMVFVAGCSSTHSEQGQQAQQEPGNYLTISGTVGFPQDNGHIILEKYLGAPSQIEVVDTIVLNDKLQYSKKVKVETAGYYRLNFYGLQNVNLILYKDDITVNVDGNNQRGFVEITGSRELDFIQKIQSMSASFQSSPQLQVLNQDFVKANQEGDQATMESLRDKYIELEKEHSKKVAAQIDSAGASLGVVEVLKAGKVLDKDEYYAVYLRQAELLKKEMSDSKIAMDFVTMVENMKRLAIGQVAPELELPDTEGKLVKLSSLRGKYVLLDFWAKWCGPCRRENPNVVRMYHKYNAKGFEVFGVSFDRKKEDWLQAIEQDGLVWTQVSDLKYWNSEAAKIYNITAIPFALLLDPEGRIIGKNLRGKKLEKKLEEIFDKG